MDKTMNLTLANETVQVCTRRISKNIVVKFMIKLLAGYLDREATCPIYGTYNWSKDFQRDGFYDITPPFIQKSSFWKNKPMVIFLQGEMSGTPEDGRKEILIKESLTCNVNF